MEVGLGKWRNAGDETVFAGAPILRQERDGAGNRTQKFK
jgi:hypothetical protein